MRHRAVKVAVAVSWASSIQLSGCLNSPFRPDFVAEANQAAARQAEVADIGEETAETDFHEESVSRHGRIQLAGGEIPESEGNTILQVSAEKKVAEKPVAEKGAPPKEAPSRFARWKFWKRGEDTAAAPSKAEATARRDAATATLNPSQKKYAKTPGTGPANTTPAKPASTAVAQKPVASDAVAEEARKSLEPKTWFESQGTDKQVARSEMPAWANGVAGSIQSKPTEEKGAVPTSASASDKLSKPFPAVADAEITAAVSGMGRSEPEWVSDGGRSSLSPNRNGVQLTGVSGVSNSNGATLTAVAQRPTSGLSESTAQRQQRLRVNALMSDAHSCLNRGELHSAYRSALLAEKIAKDHQLRFNGQDEHPSLFVQQVATRIWGNGGASGESALANQSIDPSSSPSQGLNASDWATEITAETTSPARLAAVPELKHMPITTDTNFPIEQEFGEAFATWTPISQSSGDLGTAPKSLQASRIGPSSIFPRNGSGLELNPAASWGNSTPSLPEIRPAVPGSGRATMKQGLLIGTASESGLVDEKNWTSPNGSDQQFTSSSFSITDGKIDLQTGGVQFAIAQNLSNVSEPQRVDSSPLDKESSRSLSAMSLDRQRP
ncbi:MAG TPA: hypothetical protein VNQ76_06680, partial [Planctomicrobium sp.]|nr:hypothetical protein [Planctomicrobium sp.]